MFKMYHQQVEKSLFLLSQKNGYPIQSKNGQRIYGPPKELEQYVPPAGNEIFVGNLPRTVFENELIPLFEQVGTIYQFRLMMEFSGKNRGFAFVAYMDPMHAKMAVERLHQVAIRPNCKIAVYLSVDNRKLYVGGLPKNLHKNEIEQKFKETLDGMVDVILPGKNDGYSLQGYVFLKFNSHSAAAIAKREFSKIGVLWDSELKVDWADPEAQVDPEIMYLVSIIYLHNLPLEMDFRELWAVCRIILPPGNVKHVFKHDHYAFVEFVNRNSAERGFVTFQGFFNNYGVEVAWARPTEYSKISQSHLQYYYNHLCVSVPYHHRRTIYMNKERITNRQGGSEEGSSSSSRESASPTLQLGIDYLPGSNNELQM